MLYLFLIYSFYKKYLLLQQTHYSVFGSTYLKRHKTKWSHFHLEHTFEFSTHENI